jgi:hypothetical protein
MLVIHGNDRASDAGSGLASQIKEMRRLLQFTADLFPAADQRAGRPLKAARGGLPLARQRLGGPNPVFNAW